jgi:hypothetical protein
MSNNTENELLEREARMRGFSSVTQFLMWKATPDSLMRDLMADARRGISSSASMLPPQPSKPVARGTGWIEPVPVKSPPGAEPGGAIDRMVEADTARQRQEAIAKTVKLNLEVAEELRLLEQELRRRDRELDPYDTGIYDNLDKE